MRNYLKLVSGVLLCGLMAAANVSLRAQLPGCDKWCGYGSTVDFGTRSGCGSVDGCAWVTCQYPRAGCDEGPFNDKCGTPDWC